MADNPTHSGKQKSGNRKKKSKMKDGVVLRVADIEKECDRLSRRPRAALYPLLPITEPLKLKRKSIHVNKIKRRHRKHCRKRLQGGSKWLDSRTKLLHTATTSGSDGGGGSSLANSRNHQLRVAHPHWASVELYADDTLELPPQPLVLRHHLRHHHYHAHPTEEGRRKKGGICHHDPLLTGHRTLTTSSLRDLRDGMRPHRHRRLLDPEANGRDDASVSSNSRSRKIVSFIIMSVASFILLMCVALVAVTLRLTPAIDELVRKGNEDIYRSMSAGASTSSPTTDGAANITSNSTVPSTGPPG